MCFWHALDKEMSDHVFLNRNFALRNEENMIICGGAELYKQHENLAMCEEQHGLPNRY